MDCLDLHSSSFSKKGVSSYIPGWKYCCQTEEHESIKTAQGKENFLLLFDLRMIIHLWKLRQIYDLYRASMVITETWSDQIRSDQARNPNLSPFFLANLINPCLCFASAPIDLQNSVIICPKGKTSTQLSR